MTFVANATIRAVGAVHAKTFAKFGSAASATVFTHAVARRVKSVVNTD